MYPSFFDSALDIESNNSNNMLVRSQSQDSTTSVVSLDNFLTELVRSTSCGGGAFVGDDSSSNRAGKGPEKDSNYNNYQESSVLRSPSLFKSQGTIGSCTSDFLELFRSTSGSYNTTTPMKQPPALTTSADAAEMLLSSLDGAYDNMLTMDWLQNHDDDDHDDENFEEAVKPDTTVSSMKKVVPMKRKRKSVKHVSTTNRKKKSTKNRNTDKSNDTPRVVQYIAKYTDQDVICQRGALANKHPGNHQYLRAKESLRELYNTTPRLHRGVVADQLVERVQAWGGRFVRKETSNSSSGGGLWYVISNADARVKASQALREQCTTAEARAEKRARYKK